ncbi:hypothetical protein L6164_020202 [Bauhinia variegata]|uniref:Uncharacterized protein n=1 Tax=Bauhinia variegata TaxID=167791 RepID=A0ACB9MUM2_BAUVA|nr:hypothetical protein L6164_020202 [Bauhinia variegata]
MACSYSPTSLCVLMLWVLGLASHSCYGFRTFGFDIHHRFSDPVKGILDIGGLPAKGTREYYVAMTHRDHIIRGRGLAVGDQTSLTFAGGNETFRIGSLGFLHYANVSVGTPALWFLVALDTGSDLFWLPCNCTSCVHGLNTTSGQVKFNIYGPEDSSTSQSVLCNSSLCEQQRQCPSSSSSCPYQVRYLSNGTSSTGFLVEDVLHLITDDDQTKDADTRITFGCGQVQTGSFLDGAAPNGLFGLGMENISVPSILAKEGISLNSFSMCFGSDGLGRITFGDNGSSDQGKTQFNVRSLHPTYNITVTQVIVGGNAADLEFHAIFDTGTSFTYLNDPAYTLFGQSFNSMIKEQRHTSDSALPFEYCYDLSPNQTSFEVPVMNLTMKGGDNYNLNHPIVTVVIEGSGNLFCLGIVKSNTVNIIGQNFMTGYRIVFDRDNMILGWKESDCYADKLSAVDFNPSHSPAISPAMAVNPVATSNRTNINTVGAPPPSSSSRTNPFSFAFAFIVALLPFIVIV